MSAEAGIKRVAQDHGYDLVPHECDICGWWHHVPDRWYCGCTDRNGRLKYCYATYDVAKQANKLDLTIYECPEGQGWHHTGY